MADDPAVEQPAVEAVEIHNGCDAHSARARRRATPSSVLCRCETSADRIAGDPEALETLDAYCATGSLRRAADLDLAYGLCDSGEAP
jgi:hypothetical protein